jgi:hypothetical protein
MNLTGSLAGAMLNPANIKAGGFVADAGSLPAAMLRSAAVGAPIGAAYGAGAAGPGSRAQGAASGAAMGAVTGAVTPPILAAGGALARAAGGAAKTVAAGTRNLLSPPDPEGIATQADTDLAMQKIADMAKGQGVQIPILNDPTGKGMTTAEALGRPGVSSLGALGRRSGATPDLLEAQLRNRAQGAPDRILDDFAQVSGIQPQEAAGNVQALADRLRGEAAPLYDAALSSPNPVWNADLAKLAERPVISKAIDAAGKSMLNAGEDPLAVGLRIDPDTGSYVLNGDLSSATEAVPTAATWDKVRKMVGAMVQRDPMTGKVISTGDVGITNRDLATASRDLTSALAGDPAHGAPGAIPGYRAALDKAGDYLSMQDAFNRAQAMFLNPSVRTADFAKAFGELSEPEQEAWKAGMAAKLHDQMQSGRLTPRMLTLPHVQGKAAAVLGDDPAQAFLQNVRQEAQLAATGSRMMPGQGSPTMEFLNAAGEQEAQNPVGLALRLATNPKGAAHAIYDAGASRMTSPQVRNEMGRILMQSPEDTAADFIFWRKPLAQPIIPRGLSYPIPILSGTAGSYAGARK